MAKKDSSNKKQKKKRRVRSNIILLTFLVLAIISAIVFNLPENGKDSLSEERCNVSEGYEWNKTFRHCIKESEITYCEPEDREKDVCMQLYEPVCGFKYDKSKETFSNSCFACSNTQVNFYIPGECKK